MAVYRPQEPTRDFTKSTRTWLRDPAVSAKAKGLLSYIASHSQNYNLSFEQIVAEMRDDERSVRSGIKELESHGYLRRKRRRDETGKLGGYDWHVIDFPQSSAAANPEGETQSGDDQCEHGESAGQSHTAKKPCGADQRKQDVSQGHAHTAKKQPGSDLPEQDVSAGGDHTAKRRTKKTKETMEENKEETMARTELTPNTSDRFAPSGVGGDSNEDRIDCEPDINIGDDPAQRTTFVDWRLDDLQVLADIIGSDHVISDGTGSSPAGVYSVRKVYDSLRFNHKTPKVWPGKWATKSEENAPGGSGAVVEWLARYGLAPGDPAQPSDHYRDWTAA